MPALLICWIALPTFSPLLSVSGVEVPAAFANVNKLPAALASAVLVVATAPVDEYGLGIVIRHRSVCFSNVTG